MYLAYIFVFLTCFPLLHINLLQIKSNLLLIYNSTFNSIFAFFLSALKSNQNQIKIISVQQQLLLLLEQSSAENSNQNLNNSVFNNFRPFINLASFYVTFIIRDPRFCFKSLF